MNLNYKILWFEDTPGWIKTHSAIIKDILEEKGFELELTEEVRGENIAKYLENLDFDLILVDYQLSGDFNGEKIIGKIRENPAYMNIIFYSARGPKQLREKLMEKEVDGVYCLDREPEAFIEKTELIILNTIKKVQDINNLRGLVMAEISEFDDKMLNIIKEYIGKSDENKKVISKFIFEKTENYQKCSSKKLEKDKKNDAINTYIDSSSFGTHSSNMAVSKILKLHLKEFEIEKECLNKYEKEIINQRNDLAHAKEVEIDGKKVLQSKIQGKEEQNIDEEKFIEIRKNIKKHRKNLEKIHEKISNLREV